MKSLNNYITDEVLFTKTDATYNDSFLTDSYFYKLNYFLNSFLHGDFAKGLNLYVTDFDIDSEGNSIIKRNTIFIIIKKTGFIYKKEVSFYLFSDKTQFQLYEYCVGLLESLAAKNKEL